MQLTFANADIPLPTPWHADRFFYFSDQWKRLRYLIFSKRGNRCECCGNSWSPGNPLQVDHIKPRSLFPSLALDPSNLQILCRDCNIGKSNNDLTDWRKEPP